jgi:uncharacterized RDD family membrane protein YckC
MANPARLMIARSHDPVAVEPLDTIIEIETPEHIAFRHRLAGPARRAAAYAIDVLVLAVTLFVTAIVVFTAAALPGSLVDGLREIGAGLLLLIAFAMQWVYFAACEALWGRTLGKRLLGLRVLTVSGRPIGFGAAVLRNLLRAADALPYQFVVAAPYLVALVSMTISRRFARLGDLVAGTIVVGDVQRASLGHLFALHPPARPDELALLPQSVVLDAEERDAIELFLRRRSGFGAAREHELAAMIADGLSQRLGARHPDPARLLALLYDRAVNAGRVDPPLSSRGGALR